MRFRHILASLILTPAIALAQSPSPSVAAAPTASMKSAYFSVDGNLDVRRFALPLNDRHPYRPTPVNMTRNAPPPAVIAVV